jgi:hypothetical protein
MCWTDGSLDRCNDWHWSHVLSLAEIIEPDAPVRRFKPYPAYKDSDVEWLGQIPAHWEALKLKRVCRFAYGDSLAADARQNGDIEVYGSNGSVGFHDRPNTLGPCLVIGRKGSFGKVNFSTQPVFAIDTTFLVDRRFTDADLRWLYYVLSDAGLDSASKDSAIPGLDREDGYARDVCACPETEQRAIAAFLDRETARIDALVAKKEKLIELLQEQRTALITRAVTKGLMRHLAQVVRNGMGDRAGTCIDPKTQLVQGKTVCVVSCQRSPEPVFLKWKGIETTPDGDFFVRSGPGTVKLFLDSTKEYIRTRFGSAAPGEGIS